MPRVRTHKSAHPMNLQKRQKSFQRFPFMRALLRASALRRREARVVGRNPQGERVGEGRDYARDDQEEHPQDYVQRHQQIGDRRLPEPRESVEELADPDRLPAGQVQEEEADADLEGARDDQARDRAEDRNKADRGGQDEVEQFKEDRSPPVAAKLGPGRGHEVSIVDHGVTPAIHSAPRPEGDWILARRHQQAWQGPRRLRQSPDDRAGRPHPRGPPRQA
jgi:hypothetical protein